jgi:hypothetical protein
MDPDGADNHCLEAVSSWYFQDRQLGTRNASFVERYIARKRKRALHDARTLVSQWHSGFASDQQSGGCEGEAGGSQNMAGTSGGSSSP